VAQFHFDVDKTHARSVNQTVADMRRLQVSGALLAVVFAAAAVALLMGGKLWLEILGVLAAVAAASFLWVVAWVPRKVGSIQALYDRSPLVPAVVSEVHPRALTLLSLIDIAKHPEQGHIYALVTRNTPVPQGSKPVVGERVPSVAVLDDRSKTSTSDQWQLVSPMPIWWGTKDRAVILRAEAAIPSEQWKYLAARIGQSEQVRESADSRLVIEPEDLPQFLK
jgi:hypothetical protein